MSDNELARLNHLARILKSAPELQDALNRLAGEAADVAGFPVGLVSLVLDDSQFFMGAHGLEGWVAESRGTPLEWSFCAVVVEEGAPLLVQDASTDVRFAHNPLVTEDHLRSYYGFPLALGDGAVLGSLCVIANDIRGLSSEKVAAMGALAGQVSVLLDVKP